MNIEIRTKLNTILIDLENISELLEGEEEQEYIESAIEELRNATDDLPLPDRQR